MALYLYGVQLRHTVGHKHIKYVQHIHWDLVLPDRSQSLQKKKKKKKGLDRSESLQKRKKEEKKEKRLVADLLTMTPCQASTKRSKGPLWCGGQGPRT